MPTLQPISENEFLVTIKDLEFYWQTFSGVEDATQSAKYSDGFSNRLYPLLGPREVSEVTLTKAYDPIKDVAIIQFWQDFRLSRTEDINSRGLTITVQPVEYAPEPTAIGAPVILYGFIPTKLSFAKADKTSQGVAMITLAGQIDTWSQG